MIEPKIILKNMPEEINGVCMSDGIKAVIFINKNLNSTQRECAIIHELIHLTDYPDCNFYECKNYYEICRCNWIENKVSKKTAKRLISDSILKKLIMPYLDTYPLSVLADEVNVTEEVLKVRLEVFKNGKTTR